MTPTSPAIEARSLTREFEGPNGRFAALRALDLTVERGEIVGLLGPNGAGKTTLVKILATVLLPTSGVARVGGLDVVAQGAAVRRRIGLVFGGDRGHYDRISATANLEHWAAMYGQDRRTGRRRAAELLDRVGLAGHAKQRVETFSRGMKQRLHLARGLVGDPDVLFLDEPTTGLDPVASHEMRALVRDLQRDGRTTFLTTHDMREAEEVCGRVALMDQGELLAVHSPAQLAVWASRYATVELFSPDPGLLGRISEVPGAGQPSALADGWTRIPTDQPDAADSVMQVALAAGHRTMRSSPPSLEDVYMHVFAARGMEVR